MRAKLRKEATQPEVSMSPLIDAVFLLLIFFLVATMFKRQDRDIDITPPESRSAIKLLADDRAIVIGINPEAELFLQGQAVSLQQLHQYFREVGQHNPGQQIRLDADADTPFWRVAEVLDLLQFHQLSHVGIRTYDTRYNSH